MSKSWILRTDQTLSGMHVVSTQIRPLRLAFLVPGDDPKIAARAIDSCCLTWGGYCNPIIPYSTTEGLSEEWRAILAVLDPDHIVDCVGISEADKVDFAGHHQFVSRWENPLATFFTNGALQYSALNQFLSHETGLACPVATEDDPLYLQFLARHGRLKEEFVEETLRLHGWTTDTRYAHLASLSEVDISGQPEAILLGEDIRTSFKLLTLAGLTIQGPSYSLNRGTPERPQYDEGYAECVIVTGTADSIADLALYWDLSLDRPLARSFPLWIPIDILDSDQGQSLVGRARQFLSPRMFLPKHVHDIHVLSASMNQSELESRIRDRYPVAIITTERLSRFLTGGWKCTLSQERREVSFDGGQARVPVGRPDTLQKFAAYDRVTCEMQIDGVVLPRSKSLQQKLYGVSPRITRRGGLERFAYVSNLPDLIKIHIPNGWIILASVCEDHGYDCVPSDKGRIALGQLTQLGDIEDICVIDSSRVYTLLKDLSRVDKKRTYAADRKTAQFSIFKDNWGQNPAKVIVQWLLERRILFRGIPLKCPICQMKHWYELDRISDIWHCDGCQSDRPIPLDLDKSQWAYRVNELYAHGQDQGATAHLIAMYNLYLLNQLDASSALGYYPGICLRGRQGASVPSSDIEIDLVAIIDGRLIVAECKESGEMLTEQEVSKMISIANYLRCSRLLFITTTSFPQADRLFLKAKETCTARMEWWGGEDVLDLDTSELLGFRKEQTEPEEKAKQYLEWLSRRLST